VKKYRLAWDRQHIIPDDSDLISRLFQAGMDLAVSSGIYCAATGRVIQLSRVEIEAGLQRAPQSLWMGEGNDSRELFSRKLMDERPPIIWAGNPGAPTPEELFLPSVMSWMQEPLVDLATCGSLVSVDGRAVENGQPTEIYAA